MSTTKKHTASPAQGLIPYAAGAVAIAVFIFLLGYFALPSLMSVSYSETSATSTNAIAAQNPSSIPQLDRAAYDAKLLYLAHVASSSPWRYAFLAGTSTITLPGATTSITVAKKPWPVKTTYPADGRALLPFNRIVAYYGNFYAKGMGVLGQYPTDIMLAKLASTTAQWRAADPSTPVIPAIDYIAMVAQAAPGADGKYRAVMPDFEIDKAVALANQIHGIVILDVQVGLSDLQTEIPKFEKYLKMPNVHLAVDPEFAMKTSGVKPGRVIGTLDATDINYAAAYLANLVQTYNLPPKILLVHRFTQDMVTHVSKIKPLPEVQIVMDMDGWGTQSKKIGTYTYTTASEPVQFTGFKLFYKNDLFAPSTGMMTPTQVINLTPAPSFIQYQ